MKKINWCNMFYLFIIASIAGWVIENSFNFIRTGVFVNPSALVIGPFDIAYGIGACFLTLILIEFKDKSYLKLFVIGFIGGSILEYIMSLGIELVLGFKIWDYSNYLFNINGRICLLFSIFWGILGIIWIKLLYPFINKMINKIPLNIKNTLALVLVVFLVLDELLTASAIYRAREHRKGIQPRNVYEEFLDNTFNDAYLKRMFSKKWE